MQQLVKGSDGSPALVGNLLNANVRHVRLKYQSPLFTGKLLQAVFQCLALGRQLFLSLRRLIGDDLQHIVR
jgi:hypothetical protein